MATKAAKSGPGSSELSGKRYAGLLEDALSEWDAIKTHMMEATHGDGYPPFTAPADPQREFESLSRMREQGDPAFWGDKQAIARYTALEHRYAPQGDAASMSPVGPPAQPYPQPPIPTVPNMQTPGLLDGLGA